MQTPENYPTILADIAEVFASELAGLFPESATDALALCLTEALRREFGGALIYVPVGSEYQRGVRNSAILRDFDGTNHRELARRHHLTLQSVYKICGGVRSYSRRLIAGDNES